MVYRISPLGDIKEHRMNCPSTNTTWTTFWFSLCACVFRANPAYHELLLTVLWYGVVHTSALVRCTAARMFEVSLLCSSFRGKTLRSLQVDALCIWISLSNSKMTHFDVKLCCCIIIMWSIKMMNDDALLIPSSAPHLHCAPCTLRFTECPAVYDTAVA